MRPGHDVAVGDVWCAHGLDGQREGRERAGADAKETVPCSDRHMIGGEASSGEPIGDTEVDVAADLRQLMLCPAQLERV